MIPQFALVFSLLTTFVSSFLHSTLIISVPSSIKPFPLSLSSLSQDVPVSPTSTVQPLTINIQKRKNEKESRRKQIHASTPKESPSKDVKFLLKRTQYLLDLTPTSLQSTDDDHSSEYIQRRNNKIKMHRNTFHWLIDAWANSYHLKSTFYARSLLEQMITLSSDDDVVTYSSQLQKLITPNVRSYTKVMNAYSKEGQSDSGEKAYNLLQDLIKLDGESSGDNDEDFLRPNAITYTSVLEAFASSSTPESAIRAEELCMEMIQNVVTRYENENDDTGLQPTARSYNAVIQAYSNSRMFDRAQRAEDFVKRIESLHEKHKNDGLIITPPNLFNYNTLLATYASSGLTDAAEHTERILKNVVKEPNVISYNCCLDAWAKSGHPDSGDKAFELLQTMNQMYASRFFETVKPNSRSYNSVMNAYAKSARQDGPQKAEEILDTMEELFENGNEDVKPDFFSFSTVINAWGRSYQFGKAQRVLNIFRHMIDLYEKGNESARPNVVIYNAIINACAYTSGDLSEQRKAMEIAHCMLQDLGKSPYAKADQVTYGTFLKVCENLMPQSDTRRQLVNIVFKKCSKDGQMGKLVFEELKSILTPEHFEEMIGFSSMDKRKNWKNLPFEWRCNVVEGKKRRRTRLH